MAHPDSTLAAMSAHSAASEPLLSWGRQDIEQCVGFRGSRFTRTNNWLTFLIALGLTVAAYVVLVPISNSWIAQSLTQRGPTQHVVVFLTFWSLSILAIKWRKLSFQRRALAHDVVATSPDFVLSASTAEEVLERVHLTVDDPRQFVLFNRVVIALSNLRNLGQVADVDEILRSQAEQDEAAVETSYSLVKGFIWAIPVLGFIGTVLGLSQAVAGFANVLQTTSDVESIVGALKIVTSGLATAFETTLLALVAALAIQMLTVFLRKSEDEFLDACSDYCLRRIVGRLRVMPYEQESP